MCKCLTANLFSHFFVELWTTHEELKIIEEIQAFGKLDESLDNTISDITFSEDDNGQCNFDKIEFKFLIIILHNL